MATAGIIGAGQEGRERQARRRGSRWAADGASREVKHRGGQDGLPFYYILSPSPGINRCTIIARNWRGTHEGRRGCHRASYVHTLRLHDRALVVRARRRGEWRTRFWRRRPHALRCPWSHMREAPHEGPHENEVSRAGCGRRSPCRGTTSRAIEVV
jgi:hypothetical protein